MTTRLPMSAPIPGTPLATRSTAGTLDCFFAPGQIAVIGASPKEGSIGRALLENLAEFRGGVFPINPKYASILDRPAYARLADLPGRIDLAILATPASTIPGLMQECVAAGVRGAIILSAGFRECGPDGVRLEAEVRAIAARGGVRILGPNCLGLMAPHTRLNASFAASPARPGSVAFISQSGALGTAVLDWSRREKVGFSAFVSVGSMIDVGWADLIDYFGRDPHTRSIVMYMESIGDARSFLSAAREVARDKPIIVVKVGRTAAASQAAASHTGALTGSDAVLDAVFRRAGVLRVDAIEDLFDVAEVLAKQTRPRGPRLAILTNAGGPAALAADRLVLAGGQPAVLARATLDELNGFLPAPWSHGNPIDILGDANADRYAAAFEILARDPGVDGILVVLTPQAMTDALAVAERIKGALPLAGEKPVLASWMGGAAVEAGERVLNEAGVPTYSFPDRAAQAFVYLSRYSASLTARDETPDAARSDPASTPGVQTAAAIIAGARGRGRVILSQEESKRVLAAHGIPVAGAIRAQSEDETALAAVRTGFPVVIKLHSETITHKAAVGGVRLDVRDATEARAAWRAMERDVTARAGAQHFLGVTVEPMVRGDGYEAILGSSIDSQCGPVILFGSGGRNVALLQDRALGLPPLNLTLARRLMEQTRLYAALQPEAGRPAVDLNALGELLVRFGDLVIAHPAIKEIDLNPLFLSAEQIVALDARIILHAAEVPDRDLPRPIVRPDPVPRASMGIFAHER